MKTADLRATPVITFSHRPHDFDVTEIFSCINALDAEHLRLHSPLCAPTLDYPQVAFSLTWILAYPV